MRIFFCGGLAGEWSSGWQRCQCLRELGHEILPFEQEPYLRHASLRQPMRVLIGRFYKPKVLEEFNRDLLAAILNARPEVAWLEWPLLLQSETLAEAAARLPRTKWVSFQDDNPFGSRPGEKQRWKYYLEAIPNYDLHFVKRQNDVAELKRRRAKSVRIFRHGALNSLFRPIPQDEVAGGLHNDVSFVGTPLDHRTTAIADLLMRHRIPVQIYGGRWNRTMVYHRRKECFHRPVLGQDYVRVIWGSRISLGFVSSWNQDEYTMRTFEIPACKGFFLAERTQAHQELFVEGKEAEFFSSTGECADKIRFYLKAESERNRIAERGYRRCLESDYSLHSSMAKAITQIQSLQE
jgi:hypothetical protein